MSNSIFRKDGTAQGVAKQRLIESIAKPDKRIIYDPYAHKFVLGAGITKLLGHNFNLWLSTKLVAGFHEHLIARTRFIDDLIEKSAAQQTAQYVILGAGYDSRAHRLKLPASLKIFEVDQAEVQARKRAKLSDTVENAENLIYVSVDLNQQTIKNQLLNAGFDPNKSSIFTLEGVSQYITKEGLRSTLSELADLTQKSNASFFMSYVNQRFNEDPKACFGKGYRNAEKKAETIKKLVAKVGEPWISFYSTQEIETLLSEYGFTIEVNTTISDLNEAYFGPVGRTLAENQICNLEHFLVAKNH